MFTLHLQMTASKFARTIALFCAKPTAGYRRQRFSGTSGPSRQFPSAENQEIVRLFVHLPSLIPFKVKKIALFTHSTPHPTMSRCPKRGHPYMSF